jgi:hypothetical protein
MARKDVACTGSVNLLFGPGAEHGDASADMQLRNVHI